jgi:serine/threonine-protein kinase haspin
MQCYVVFVLQHGGKDLESFVLLNFDEVHSLLVQVMMYILFKHFLSILHWAATFKIYCVYRARQVTAGLAIAEAAYEFEHRDLHWFVVSGNK